METKLTDQQIARLIEEARKARQRAYAPYSRFQVGAALLGTDGNVYPGCNVENGSFGLTLCAERAAVGSAVASDCRDFHALAIYSETDDESPITPCGACRQVLAEFNPFLTIICANEKESTRVFRLDELLPFHFEFGLR
jgi:cytidine deaminase